MQSDISCSRGPFTFCFNSKFSPLRITRHVLFYFSFIFLLSIKISAQSNCSFSQVQKGRVLDEQQRPLELVSVSIQQTNTGTVTNKEGFFELKLPEDKLLSIIISHIGYKTDTLTIPKERSHEFLTVVLKPAEYTTDDVIITSDKYNRAERIILRTIEQKNSYFEKMGNYTSLNYNKLFIKDGIKKDSNITLYEFVSYLHHVYQKTDNEEVLSSRSEIKAFPKDGSPNIFGTMPCVYSEHLILTNINCISPLCDDALDYFIFDVSAISNYDNKSVYKISFKPKSQNVNIPSGSIDIIDSLFQVAGFEVEIPQASLNPLSNKTVVRQTFKEYKDNLWLPVTSLIESSFPAMRDKKSKRIRQMSLAQLTLINNYNFGHINIKPPERNIYRPQITYWDSVQTIPLTSYEKSMAFKIDSLFSSSLILRSITYVDVLNRLPFRDFNDFYHFNRVEGHYLGIGISSKKYLFPFVFAAKYGYGFSDKKSKFVIEGKYFINDQINIFGTASSDIEYLNGFYDYSQFDLSFRSVVFGEDYADYYYSRKGLFGLELKPTEELTFGISFNQEIFSNAKIDTDWTLFHNDKYRSLTDIDECKANYIKLSLKFDNSKYVNMFSTRYKDSRQDHLLMEFELLLSSKDYLGSEIEYKRITADIDLNKRFTPLFNFGLIARFGAAQSNIPQFNFHLPANISTIGDKLNIYRTIHQDKYWGDKIINIYFQNNFSNAPFSHFYNNFKAELILFGNLSWINNDHGTASFMQSSFRDKPISEAGIGLNNLIFSGLRVDFALRLDRRDADPEYGWSISWEF